MPGFDFSVFLVNLVAHEHDWDVVADSGEILVPLGDVLIGDTGGDVEHQDGGVSSDIVSFSKSTEFFLAGCIPERKLDGSVVGVEGDGANFNSLGGDVFFFELAGDVPFDEGGFADTAVSNEHYFELSNWFDCLHVNRFTSIMLM